MSSPEQNQSRGHVSTLRRLLRRGPEADASDHQRPLIDTSSQRKPHLASSMLLRGLGCASSAAAHVPSSSGVGAGGAQVAASAVREAADWDGKRRRSKKKKKKEKKRVASSSGGGATSADVWCVEASVDCVVERAHRERPCISRRVTVQEQISAYKDSPLDAHFFGPDLTPPGRLHRARAYHHHRHHSPPDLEEEIMMYSTRMLFGGSNLYDRHRDWRLDVDHMSYEELLELGDRIGYVNTGLREEDILGKVRAYVFDPSALHFSSSEAEKKCSICQEEYEANEEMGKLECGHGYHVYCIKQWLSRKNSCPVCKTSISKS
ncbi:RING/U-box superfamily protein [Rhynchospora pubera]|uniref:RING-type E3 ubiquitin transferase n=1 Tax=Rhynchospora pubera TaxID=906938 RepID=A0AAV8C434_9POAL|nr:RING/U-box superfamily protein [Rhynchospora pubera]